MLAFIVAHKVLIVGSLLAIYNEALAWMPSIQSNSIVQLVVNTLKSLAGK